MNTKSVINRDTLNYFARTNERMLTGPIRGVVLEFPGLGGGSCMGGIDAVGENTSLYALRCAHENLLQAYVFTGPWSWMNRPAVEIADAVVDAIWERYSLSDDIPLLSTGGSMGGCGALLYARYSRHRVAACAANGPGCDMMALYKSHVDFARTIFNAVAFYDCDFDEALRSLSANEQVPYMPRIPYYIVHTSRDEVIPIEKHSDIFVRRMREAGHQVEYHVVPDRLHCDLESKDAYALFDWIIDTAKRLSPVKD